jgi:hypothetical protein
MIYESHIDLIKYLAKCNGTGKLELEKRIKKGEVEEKDKDVIWFYVAVEKLNQRIDAVANKL